MTYKIVSRAGIIQYKGDAFSRINAQFVEAHLQTEDDIIKYAHDADAVIAGPWEPYSRRVIEALSKCKVISRSGIGYNNIDINAATEYGIPVAYVPDAMISEVSDHTMALILSFTRKLIPLIRAVTDGAWQPGGREIIRLITPLYSLGEQTLGLVGLGRIGTAVCKKAKAFGMRLIVHDPYIPLVVIEELGAESVNFDKLLAESDYISIHAPLTDETRQLFGLEQFKKMKPTAYIINTSRGELIDKEALVNALSSVYLAGAGLDVTDPEPLEPNDPLLKMENVIITAHTAFYSERSMSELSRRSVDAVLSVLNGQWPRDLVNPSVKESANCRLMK